MKNASFEKTKKKLKSSKTFKTNLSKHLTHAFYMYSSKQNRGMIPLSSDDLFDKKWRPNFLKKKETSSVLKKFSVPVVYKMIHAKKVTWLAL